LTENCYRDLIASGRYRYKQLIEAVDRNLLEIGTDPQISLEDAQQVTKCLSTSGTHAKIRAKMNYFEGKIRKLKGQSREWIRDKMPFQRKSVQ